MSERQEMLQRVMDILDTACQDPIGELRKSGEAIINLADALGGLSLSEAKKVISAAILLS